MSFFGCSDDNGGNGQPTTDATDDGDSGTDIADGGCTIVDDCAADEVCFDGECVAATACEGIKDYDTCKTELTSMSPELGRYAACLDGYCRPTCATDNDCRAGRICSDFGRCIPFTGTLGDGPTGHGGERLQAGYGETLLDYPIGVPLGGYGNRSGKRVGRYAETLPGSIGTYNGQYARAVVFDNGETELLLIRVPIIFTTFAMHERVARRLQEETGADWRDHLVIASTHTHSGPARFWRLPSVSVLPLGVLGVGSFAQPMEDRLVESITSAALAALADKEPASVGWKIVEGFDVDDTVASDRWEQTPPFDDNRLLLIRVDGPDDKPKAVLFSYGAHGTDNSSNWATDDVLGGAEDGLSTALSQEFGQYVPTLFFPQNSGSMSPSSGSQGHRFPHSRERAGYVITQKAFDQILELDTHEKISLRSRTYRFPISYDIVGYERGEFGAEEDALIPGEFSTGAIQCGSRVWGDTDYTTWATPETIACFPLNYILYGQQPTPLTRSQMTAIEFDGLSILTAPGELTMDLGWELTRVLVEREGIDPHTFWTLPYANDHLLYLTPTKVRGGLPPYEGFRAEKAPEDQPEYAHSFFQGGYEPTLTPWGWRFGDFLAERAVDAWRHLTNEDASPGVAPTLPMEYSRDESESGFSLSAEDATTPAMTSEPPSAVTRLTPVEFSWVGGVAGAEAPQTPLVTLVRVDGIVPQDVVYDNFKPYTNREPVMATRVRGEEGAIDEWVVRWEAPKDFPLGQYKFRIEGHHVDESGAIQPYTLETGFFTLTPFDAMVVTHSFDDSGLAGSLSYGVPAAFSYIDDNDVDRGEFVGALRMRHPLVPDSQADPPIEGVDISEADVTFEDESGNTIPIDPTVTTSYEDRGNYSGVPVTRYRFDFDFESSTGGEYAIKARDAYGNSGTSTFQAGTAGPPGPTGE